MRDIIRIACAFLLGYALADYSAELKAKAHMPQNQQAPMSQPAGEAATQATEHPLATCLTPGSCA